MNDKKDNQQQEDWPELDWDFELDLWEPELDDWEWPELNLEEWDFEPVDWED